MPATGTVEVKLLDAKETQEAIRSAYEQGVRDAAKLIGNIDALDVIPGATLGLPEYNPLWDAARYIERELLP